MSFKFIDQVKRPGLISVILLRRPYPYLALVFDVKHDLLNGFLFEFPRSREQNLAEVSTLICWEGKDHDRDEDHVNGLSRDDFDKIGLRSRLQKAQ